MLTILIIAAICVWITAVHLLAFLGAGSDVDESPWPKPLEWVVIISFMLCLHQVYLHSSRVPSEAPLLLETSEVSTDQYSFEPNVEPGYLPLPLLDITQHPANCPGNCGKVH